MKISTRLRKSNEIFGYGFKVNIPEGRLLLEILLDKEPNEYIEDAVWLQITGIMLMGEISAFRNETFQIADRKDINQ